MPFQSREIDAQELAALAGGYHGDPFRLLGPHPVQGGRWQVRAFFPAAREAWLVLLDREQPMVRWHENGVFAAELDAHPGAYLFRVIPWTGPTKLVEDPYRFPPLLAAADLELFAHGAHVEAQNLLGAHLVDHEGATGVRFAVWAPNAECAFVTGGFNHWDLRSHPMRRREHGVWELFVPSVKAGEKYKYYLRSRFKGYRVLKADPFGFGHEIAPQTASIVTDPGLYQWRDSEWMDRRTSFQPLDAPLSIYELHAASWKRKENGDPCNYRELADQLIPYLLDLNYTHVELLPVLEHPFEGSWGYQVTGFFAPASRYGAPDDFRYFVDSCHQAGLGVILDWVPGHFPRDQHGLHFFDGSFLYEHADPRKGEHKEWGTMIFNYGRPEVRSFLLSSALFWLKEFHIDGFRVDAVASMLYLDYSRNEGEWEPNQFGGRENLEAISFLRRFNELCHTVPGVFTVAEESTSFPAVSRPVYTGGLGFTFKWNMGWMHDMLAYFKTDPVFRKGQHQKITFSLFYAFTENFVLPISHDEVVHGKGSLISRMPGDEWQRFANVRAFLAYMYTHPGKKLLFMGQEIGQYEEWSEKRSVRWEILDFNLHRRLRDFVRTLNEIYREEPALHEVDFHWKGFDWIDFQDVDSSVISFIRRGRWIGEQIVVACNFTPVVRPSYRIGVPMAGDYDELFNSDAPEFGGSGIGSGPTLRARPGTMHGQEYSVELTLPPLAVVAYKWRAPGDLPADPKGKREELPDPLHALSGRLREEDWEVEPEWAFALSE